MDSGAFSLGDGALKWDAIEGFKEISAERLTGTNATVYAKIGKNQSGIDQVAIYDTADDTQPMFTITLYNVGLSNPRAEVIARGEMWIQTAALIGSKEIHQE